MAKYSEKAQDKIEKVMHEYKRGMLKSSSGKKVTRKKQALAIGLSEARAAGARLPEKSSAKKSASKEPAAKKTAAKKRTR